MKGGYERALEWVEVQEGGPVDLANDPRTGWGVIQETYDTYRRWKKLPLRDVFLITIDEKKEIFKRMFWDRCYGELLPHGVALSIFDHGITAGDTKAVKLARKSITVDNEFRPLLFIDNFTWTRLNWYQSLSKAKLHTVPSNPNSITFGEIWRKRTGETRAVARAFAGDTSKLPTLKKGQRRNSRYTAFAQKRMNSRFGLGLSVDGVYGDNTEWAVGELQIKFKLGTSGELDSKLWERIL